MARADYILVTGLSGAGKTTLSRELSGLYGVNQVNAGECLLWYLRKRNVVFDGNSAKDIGKTFLETFSEEEACDAILEGAKGNDARIIDGVRLPSTVGILKEKGYKTYIVHVACAEELRRKRLLQRLSGSHSDPGSISEAFKNKERYRGGVESLIKSSDCVFDNSNELHELRAFADHVVDAVRLA